MKFKDLKIIKNRKELIKILNKMSLKREMCCMCVIRIFENIFPEDNFWREDEVTKVIKKYNIKFDNIDKDRREIIDIADFTDKVCPICKGEFFRKVMPQYDEWLKKEVRRIIKENNITFELVTADRPE